MPCSFEFRKCYDSSTVGVYFKIFSDLIFSKKPFEKEGTLAPFPPGQEGRVPPLPLCSGNPVGATLNVPLAHQLFEKHNKVCILEPYGAAVKLHILPKGR